MFQMFDKILSETQVLLSTHGAKKDNVFLSELGNGAQA
jgi:hypothetical protein